MMTLLTYGMVYAGSALMVYNIYRYIKFETQITKQGGWEQERHTFILPIILLVMFLVGYLAVGIFGQPDLIIGGILLGGSIFVLLMILFIDHIVERVQEHERLRSRLREAEQSNRAKSSFLSVMSHEIRTPLSAIISLNDLALKDPDLSEKDRETHEKIEANSRHLLSLINDVLDISRIESGEMDLVESEFSPTDLINDINETFKKKCTVKGLAYQTETIGIHDEHLIGDETKLKQVINNVLENAVKFTDAPGTVSFTTEQVTSFGNMRTLRFTVSDTGIGIDKEFLPNLFTPFSQEDSSHSNRHGGTGLGMAISKNIIDMMNGEISVESEKGVGTTFVITVTLKACTNSDDQQDAAHQSDGEQGDNGADQPNENMRILVVEDVDMNAEIIMDILDLEDIESERAANGQEAVEMLKNSDEGYYDAILMDMRMPIMDGLAATKAIRALDRPEAQTIPIIALTANALAEDAQRCLQAGMNAHLTKPADPDELYATLREATAR